MRLFGGQDEIRKLRAEVDYLRRRIELVEDRTRMTYSLGVLDNPYRDRSIAIADVVRLILKRMGLEVRRHDIREEPIYLDGVDVSGGNGT